MSIGKLKTNVKTSWVQGNLQRNKNNQLHSSETWAIFFHHMLGTTPVISIVSQKTCKILKKHKTAPDACEKNHKIW